VVSRFYDPVAMLFRRLFGSKKGKPGA
jgi:hypothetical protein